MFPPLFIDRKAENLTPHSPLRRCKRSDNIGGSAGRKGLLLEKTVRHDGGTT